MKAVICTNYGPPEVLRIDNVQNPVPSDNELLIKIIASAVNSGDVRVRGLAVEGFLKIVMSVIFGFSRPRNPILGTVYSGIVEKVGKNITTFTVGDEVYGLTGLKFGAYAEYMTVSDKSVVSRKPSNATFEEAAAILFGGQAAIYFLQKAKITERSNPEVLVYGATGSVGTSALQIAKHYNARVTAVCSEKGQDLVRELGAEKIVLYTKEDFTKIPEKFDIIFDAVGKTTKRQCKHLLNTVGNYMTVGGLDVAAERIEQLKLLCELFENGKYDATIDRTYSMDEIVEAHRYVDTGRKKGNVVVKMSG